MSRADLARRRSRPHVVGDRTAQTDAGRASAAGPSLRRAHRTGPPRGNPCRGCGKRRARGRGGGRGDAARRRGGLRTRPGPRAARTRHDRGDVVGADGGRGPGAARAAPARAAERSGGRLAHRRACRDGGMAGGGDRRPARAQRLVGEVAATDRACAASVGPGACEAWRAFGARGVGTALHTGAAKPEGLRAALRGHPWQGPHQAPGRHARDRPGARRSAEPRPRAARPGAVPASRRGGRESRRRRRPQGPGAPGHGPPDRERAEGAAAESPGRSVRAHRGDRGRSRPGQQGGRGCWNGGYEPRFFS